MFPLLLATLTVLLLSVPLLALYLTRSPAAEGAPQPMFGRMFPSLPAYDRPDDAALTALICGQDTSPPSPLCTSQRQVLPTGPKMGPLFDQNIAAPASPNDDNPNNVPAFFTYFGQFVDHDMTLDKLPLPTQSVDPATIPNHRDPRFNLDSVYGRGPGNGANSDPQLYQADGQRLKENSENDRDLPRDLDGSAILVEGRNDENQIIAQIHVAFLRAHNKLIDDGYKFQDAQQLMRYRHQWIIVHEFLPEVLDADVYHDVFRSDGIHTRYYDPNNATKAEMPVEFSVADYRFGHSMVRKAYIMIENGPKLQVFNNSTDDLHGGRPIADNHLIFWPNFLEIDGQPGTGQPGTGQPVANVGRKIDTLLSSGLFLLPIPGAEPEGSAVLAKRNLQRAREYGVPSGQAVAMRLKVDDPSIHVYTNAEIAASIPRLAALTGIAYQTGSAGQPEAPLWLYILAESQIASNGEKLGPVGSRIVAEVMGGLLAADNKSYYRKNWTPEGGDFRAQDLLREAGLLPGS